VVRPLPGTGGRSGYDAAMSPLVALTLTAFGGVLVLALLLWSLLSPRRRPPPPTAAAAPAPEARRTPPVSNDEVRGARVRPPDRPKADDPFEQFLRAGSDDR
jgi:hypothetical protein